MNTSVQPNWNTAPAAPSPNWGYQQPSPNAAPATVIYNNMSMTPTGYSPHTAVRTHSSGMAYFLWLFGLIGICGLHRFYTRQYGTAILWLITFGLLGIGQFIDLFLIPSRVRMVNIRSNQPGQF